MLKNGKLTVRDKIAAVLTYPYKPSDIMLQHYHLYWKYFLIKKYPCHGDVNNTWGGPIIDPDPDEHEYEEALFLEYENNFIVKRRYVDQFFSFQQTIEITSLEILDADSDLLQRIRLECEG